MKYIPIMGAAVLLACLAPACAQIGKRQDLADLSLEELVSIEVTSVSRRAERVSEAAASIYVITAERIRRSGVTSLPEALRLAPNLQVARTNSGEYAISARGFNNAIGNKLLVLIDGRTVYASFFSGVLWDQQDLMLEDVERIEVISGPGATLWGANAVNGVINVITRSAADTQGGLVVAGGGEHEWGGAWRYGGELGAGGRFRIYGKNTKLHRTSTGSGADVIDARQRNQVGFRADWLEAGNGFTLQGDVYAGKTEQRGVVLGTNLGSLETSGENLLGRWTRRLQGGSDLRVQAYYDQFKRDDALLYRPRARTLDLEFQHGVPLGGHRLLWGGGYRNARDDLQPGLFFGFVPVKRSMNWKNLFAQDEVDLSERVRLTVGMKLESNDYTGTEKLPSVRLAWKPSNDQLIWGGASRAVRAPARLDRDIRLPATPPYLFIVGGPDFVSEVANVTELGYRAQPISTLSFSITGFHHDWDRLRSGQLPPALVQNMIEGATYGVEAWATWQATPSWRLSGGFTTLKKDLRLKPGSADPDGPKNLGNDPDYQWSLQSAFNLSDSKTIDLGVRRVAALPSPAVPAYTAVDLRLGWRVNRDVELSIVGQNLIDPKHAEFDAAPGRSETPRSLALWVRWSL